MSFLVYNSLWIAISVVMLAKERHGEHKKVDRKTYIQVTETRYKWTGLESSYLIGSWESSRVATIVLYASGISRDCVTWVWIALTCIYGGGWVHYVGSTTISFLALWPICQSSSVVYFKNSLEYPTRYDSPSVYPFDEIPAAEHGFEKFSRSCEILFIFYFISSCLIVSASNISKYL